ncbi:MAG: dethiobiotin synthase [Nocardioides sp.]
MTGRVMIVTGTSTDVGKTIATAALAATTPGRVVVVKPVQTGVASGEPGDADVVHRLSGCDVQTWVELPEPLAPDTAARRAGVALPRVSQHAAQVLALCGQYDVVIVEGAGGLLVRLDTEGGTLLHMAETLASSVVLDVHVVCSAGLGTLNHTELTVNALRARDVRPRGLVIGSWPQQPGLAEQCNVADLPRVTGVPISGIIPAGAGALTPSDFVAQSAGWFKNHR